MVYRNAVRVIGSIGRFGAPPDAEDERLSSLAGRDEAMLASRRCGYTTWNSVEYKANDRKAGLTQGDVMMLSTFGELRWGETAEARFKHHVKVARSAQTCGQELMYCYHVLTLPATLQAINVFLPCLIA